MQEYGVTYPSGSREMRETNTVSHGKLTINCFMFVSPCVCVCLAYINKRSDNR